MYLSRLADGSSPLPFNHAVIGLVGNHHVWEGGLCANQRGSQWQMRGSVNQADVV